MPDSADHTLFLRDKGAIHHGCRDAHSTVGPPHRILADAIRGHLVRLAGAKPHPHPSLPYFFPLQYASRCSLCPPGVTCLSDPSRCPSIDTCLVCHTCGRRPLVRSSTRGPPHRCRMRRRSTCPLRRPTSSRMLSHCPISICETPRPIRAIAIERRSRNSSKRLKSHGRVGLSEQSWSRLISATRRRECWRSAYS